MTATGWPWTTRAGFVHAQRGVYHTHYGNKETEALGTHSRRMNGAVIGAVLFVGAMIAPLGAQPDGYPSGDLWVFTLA